MSKEFDEWLLKGSLNSFQLLKDRIGKQIVVYFNKVVEEHLPPVQAQIKGVLNEIKDFSHVVVSGTVVHFVNFRHIISTIIDATTNETLYDKTLIVNPLTKVKNSVAKYQQAILGLAPSQTKTSELSKTIA